MKYFIILALFVFSFEVSAQTEISYQKSPVFEECEGKSFQEMKTCFRFQLHSFIFNNFKVPQVVTKDNYKGDIKLLFEVDKEGVFQLIFVDAAFEELKTEAQRVFDALPKIEPAKYDGKPTYIQYSTAINIPLNSPSEIDLQAEVIEKKKNKSNKDSDLNAVLSNEIDSINASLKPYDKAEYSSQLNIPFTHTYYARFDASMNAIGTNAHTAAKPFLYDDVAPYYDVKAEKEALANDAQTWGGRKLWNEHLVQAQGKDYWFTIDPVLDLQVGKDTEADFNTTFNNTRGVYIQAGIGKKFNFTTSFLESQGRFAQYFNHYHCAYLPIYVQESDDMHTIFFGGIAQFYEENGGLVQDNDVPFVNTIADVSRNAFGDLNETILSTTMPGYLGAGSIFIIDPKTELVEDDIIDGSKIGTDFQSIGYIYGGIRSSMPNIFWVNTGEESEASQTIYKVSIRRVAEINSIVNNEERDHLQFYPNPARQEVRMSIDIDQPTDFSITITDVKGGKIHTQVIKKETVVSGRNILVLDEVNVGYGAFYYTIQMGDKKVTRKVIWSE